MLEQITCKPRKNEARSEGITNVSTTSVPHTMISSQQNQRRESRSFVVMLQVYQTISPHPRRTSQPDGPTFDLASPTRLR